MKIEYLFFIVKIVLGRQSHANAVLINRKDKSVLRLEPHGRPPIGMNYDWKTLDREIDTYIETLISDKGLVSSLHKTFISRWSTFQPIGIQLIENIETESRHINDPGGFCGIWSIYLVLTRIAYSTPFKSFQMLEINRIKRKDLVRMFASLITNLRDETYAKCNMDINELTFGEINSDQMQKLRKTIRQVHESLL